MTVNFVTYLEYFGLRQANDILAMTWSKSEIDVGLTPFQEASQPYFSQLTV